MYIIEYKIEIKYICKMPSTFPNLNLSTSAFIEEAVCTVLGVREIARLRSERPIRNWKELPEKYAYLNHREGSELI